MIQTAEDKVKEYCQCIRREIEQWKDINQNGCNDPFWSDGCNMNLTRNISFIISQRSTRPAQKISCHYRRNVIFPYRRKWIIIIWQILSRNHGWRDCVS